MRCSQILAVVYLVLCLPVASIAADLTVGTYALVSSKRISLTVFEYVYSANIANTGPSVKSVTASGSSSSPYITFVDKDLAFGDVAAGATVKSRDTFTVRHDRRGAFDTTKLAWEVTALPVNEIINGIAVPPEPDATINTASLGGVDSNNDGVRDDIERTIATEFGTDTSLYTEVKMVASTLQSVIANATPTIESITAHVDTIRCCNDDQKLYAFDRITRATLDTPMRRQAYANAFAGTVMTEEGCP